MMQTLFNSGSHSILRNRDGNIDTVLVSEKITLETSVGKLVPRFTVDEESRKKEAPVKFYRTKELKSLPLEEITEIPTSVGPIKAELLTFYQSGALRRIFPLNGKITGYWTEENEYQLAETLEIPSSVGIISVKAIYLQFFETGELESIGFWPTELLEIKTSVGNVKIRKGISFYKNGNLKGFEPASEIEVDSPIGKIKVYDPDPNGLFAENNALNFYENGEVKSVTTSSCQVIVRNEEENLFSPKTVSSYCDESAFFISPMKITFEPDSISFQTGQEPKTTLSASLDYTVEDFIPKHEISQIACG